MWICGSRNEGIRCLPDEMTRRDSNRTLLLLPDTKVTLGFRHHALYYTTFIVQPVFQDLYAGSNSDLRSLRTVRPIDLYLGDATVKFLPTGTITRAIGWAFHYSNKFNTAAAKRE